MFQITWNDFATLHLAIFSSSYIKPPINYDYPITDNSFGTKKAIRSFWKFREALFYAEESIWDFCPGYWFWSSTQQINVHPFVVDGTHDWRIWSSSASSLVSWRWKSHEPWSSADIPELVPKLISNRNEGVWFWFEFGLMFWMFDFLLFDAIPNSIPKIENKSLRDPDHIRWHSKAKTQSQNFGNKRLEITHLKRTKPVISN